MAGNLCLENKCMQYGDVVSLWIPDTTTINPTYEWATGPVLTTIAGSNWVSCEEAENINSPPSNMNNPSGPSHITFSEVEPCENNTLTQYIPSWDLYLVTLQNSNIFSGNSGSVMLFVIGGPQGLRISPLSQGQSNTVMTGDVITLILLESLTLESSLQDLMYLAGFHNPDGSGNQNYMVFGKFGSGCIENRFIINILQYPFVTDGSSPYVATSMPIPYIDKSTGYPIYVSLATYYANSNNAGPYNNPQGMGSVYWTLNNCGYDNALYLYDNPNKLLFSYGVGDACSPNTNPNTNPAGNCAIDGVGANCGTSLQFIYGNPGEVNCLYNSGVYPNIYTEAYYNMIVTSYSKPPPTKGDSPTANFDNLHKTIENNPMTANYEEDPYGFIMYDFNNRGKGKISPQSQSPPPNNSNFSFGIIFLIAIIIVVIIVMLLLAFYYTKKPTNNSKL